MNPRLIAFYLPQYHPIPENDEWWGKGFTEWTNVAKAKPLFKGHYQPHLPADLGFYDLRVPEVREQQAELAREAGIEGFCYWHYWFAGKQLLERPFTEVLASGKPDFPFCLAWANQTWTGIWHGAPDRVLIEQTYPGKEDHIAHFNALLPAFMDNRYIRVDDKPLLVIFRPNNLPDPESTLSLWQELAIRAGLKGLFFVCLVNDFTSNARYKKDGYNAFTLTRVSNNSRSLKLHWRILYKAFGKENTIKIYQHLYRQPYNFYDFQISKAEMVLEQEQLLEYFPCITPNWDNTPRSGLNGFVGINSSPQLFKENILKAIERVNGYQDSHKVVFLKAWNEWAEGNYLEPDLKYGKAFLNALKEAIYDAKAN